MKKTRFHHREMLIAVIFLFSYAAFEMAEALQLSGYYPIMAFWNNRNSQSGLKQFAENQRELFWSLGN